MICVDRLRDSLRDGDLSWVLGELGSVFDQCYAEGVLLSDVDPLLCSELTAFFCEYFQ